MVVYATFLGGYCLHGVVHAGQSVLFRGYTPGVVTAVAVVLPTSAHLYARLLRAGVLGAQLGVATAVAGLVLFLPVVVVAGEIAVLVER